jgi:hypothetical protein
VQNMHLAAGGWYECLSTSLIISSQGAGMLAECRLATEQHSSSWVACQAHSCPFLDFKDSVLHMARVYFHKESRLLICNDTRALCAQTADEASWEHINVMLALAAWLPRPLGTVRHPRVRLGW